MKVLDLTNEENASVVKGPGGVDKVPAKVQPGSFVVPAIPPSTPPASNVNLTNGEVVIPPKEVPKVDQKIKQAGGNGITDLAPNSLPNIDEINAWNKYLMYFNKKVADEKVSDEQLDEGDTGEYARKAYEEYAAQNKLPYQYSDFTMKMQKYYNDLYNSNNPLASTSVKSKYPKTQLSNVDGRIGSLTRNYYTPVYNYGKKSDTGKDNAGMRAIFDPYTGGISVVDSVNMTNDKGQPMSNDELNKFYLEMAQSRARNSAQNNNPGFAKGGFVPSTDGDGTIENPFSFSSFGVNSEKYKQSKQPVYVENIYNDANGEVVNDENKPFIGKGEVIPIVWNGNRWINADSQVNNKQSQGVSGSINFPPPAEIPKTIPYTPQGYNPTIPTLQEQAQKSLGIGGAKLDTSAPETTPQEDTNSIDYLTRGNNYVNALEAILQNAKPKPDPEKEKRYKQRAAFNSIGEGLKTVFEGVNHTRGMNVTPNTGAVAGQSNAALAAYNDDMEKKMDAYKNLVTQVKLSGLNYKEQLQTMGDQMNMEFAKQKSINQQKANELQFERWYKTTALDQDNKQFLAKLFQDGQLSMMEMKRKEGESLQQHKDRMAMLAEQRRNNNLDYAAAMNRGKYDKTTAPISFINNGQPDEISPSAVRTMALARQKEIESKMVDRHGNPDPDALKDAAQTPGEYQQILKYLQGGLTVPEMQILAQDLYNTGMQAKTKQFSKNDMNAAYNRVYGGSNGTPQSSEKGYTIQSW